MHMHELFIVDLRTVMTMYDIICTYRYIDKFNFKYSPKVDLPPRIIFKQCMYA